MAHAKHALIALFLLRVCSPSHAESLAEPSPLHRLMDVAQFGMPQDAKLIFCDGRDCPERTAKTIDTPKAPPTSAPVFRPQAVRPVDAVPQPQSIQPPAELSRAKVKQPHRTKKRPAHKKRAARMDCGPDAKS